MHRPQTNRITTVHSQAHLKLQQWVNLEYRLSDPKHLLRTLTFVRFESKSLVFRIQEPRVSDPSRNSDDNDTLATLAWKRKGQKMNTKFTTHTRDVWEDKKTLTSTHYIEFYHLSIIQACGRMEWVNGRSRNVKRISIVMRQLHVGHRNDVDGLCACVYE